LLSYLICVRKIHQNERGKNLEAFFGGISDKPLFKNKSKATFLMALPLNYNNLFYSMAL